MRAFTDLGLEVHITELDVRLPVDRAGQAAPQDLERQAQAHQNVVRACLDVRGCKAIQVWGFSDAHSWIPRFFPGYGAGTLFDSDYRAKPAYGVVLDLLSQQRPADCNYMLVSRISVGKRIMIRECRLPDGLGMSG